MDKWTLLSGETALETPWFTLKKNRYRVPHSGAEHDQYILKERTGVNIIAITADDEVVMIHQYRPGADVIMYEFPAGYIEDGEDPLETAKRELLEETGYTGGTWYETGKINSMPNRADKTDDTFLAVGVQKTDEQNPDLHERIEVVTFPIATVEEKIARSEITCTTCIASYHKGMAWLAEKQEL